MNHAQQVLEAKLALEDELVEPLWLACSAYIGTWASSEGQMRMWDQVGHREDIERVLIRHYARVLSVMSGKVPDAATTLEGAALGLAQAARLRARAQNQAMHIVRGLDRDLATILMALPAPTLESPGGDKAEADLEQKAKGGKPFSVQLVGRFKETAKQAWTKLKGRMRALANVETETVAEEHRLEWVKQANANSRIWKRWVSLMDGRERQWHHDAHDQEVPVDQPFVVGGELLKHPGDNTMGASLSNLINCFPGDTRVSGAVCAATRHWFQGEIVEIVTRGGHKLAATPNHPVLTSKGWIALGLLNEGDDLVRSGERGRLDAPAAGQSTAALHDAQHVEDVEPQIEQVFDALAADRAAVRPVGLAVNFHGDIPAHDVDIVGADRVLWFGVEPARLQRSHEISLGFPDLGAGLALPKGLESPLGIADPGSATRRIGGRYEVLSAGGVGLGHPGAHALTSVARGDSGVEQYLPNKGSADTHLGSDGLHGASRSELDDDVGLQECPSGAARRSIGTSARAGRSSLAHPLVDGLRRDAGSPADLGNGKTTAIEVDRVVSVRRQAFSGHVFNLQTIHGLYHANGFVAHNCRCSAEYFVIGPNGERLEIGLQTPALPARRRWHAGDRPGIETPVLPTSRVALSGRTNARVVLGDGRTFANLRQVTPTTLVVRVGGRDVARAEIANGAVSRMVIAPGHEHLDIDGLIRRSVAGR